jgi:hypothetical protein
MDKWVPIGALAGTAFDLLIDFPLSDAGAYYAWVIRDAEGRYVWGVGTGDVLGAAVGGGLAVAGKSLEEVSVERPWFRVASGFRLHKNRRTLQLSDNR